MPATRLRIFVSSVQKELADERRAIADFARKDPLLKDCFEVFLFEELPASDRRADSVYLGEVERCDVFVALLGSGYGFTDAEGISPTEREFDHASARGKQRLVFVKDANDADRDPRMRALVEKAAGQLIRRRFAGPADLQMALYASLVGELQRTGRLRFRPFDAAACPGAGIEDIADDKVRRFLSRASSERHYPLGADTPVADALAHLNLLDDGQPTHAAVLLFGREPQRFLIASELKCMHFHGTDVRKPIPSYQVYRGTVFELVDQALDFVMSKINRRVGTRVLGPEAPVEYELPREAVAEAIVNAVAHRDYTSNASVQVMLFADRLEVWNPGELPPGLTIDLLARPHASIPRNPLIADPFFLARYAEKAGSGILDMIARCREAGLPAPSFRQEGGQFIQTLGRPDLSTAPEVTPEVTPEVLQELSPAQRLVRVLEGEMTRQQLQDALGLKDDEHFRRAYLQPALDAGLIEMTIPGKPRSSKQKYRRRKIAAG